MTGTVRGRTTAGAQAARPLARRRASF